MTPRDELNWKYCPQVIETLSSTENGPYRPVRVTGVPMLTFNDFAVDQVYRSGPGEVSDEDVQGFVPALGSASTFDMLSFAEQGLFGRWLVSAITMRLLATGELQVEGGTQGLGVDELEWGVPIKAKDVLRLESRVVEVRESRSNPKFGIVTMRTTTMNQNDEIVQTCTHSFRAAKKEAG